MNHKIEDIGEQIKNIQSSLSTLCSSSTGVAPGGSSVDQKAASGQATTYASVAVASKVLKDAVQFAVDATIRKHKMKIMIMSPLPYTTFVIVGTMLMSEGLTKCTCV